MTQNQKRSRQLGVLRSLSSVAYVFDNDGTLVDTESVWFETYQRLLNSYGSTHDLATHRQMMGQSAKACVKILQHVHSTLPQGEEAIASLVTERKRLFQLTRAEKGVKAMSGVEDFLRWSQQRGIRLAVATSASREDMDWQFRTLGWQDLFLVVVTGDDVVKLKPAPDIYLEAAKRLGVDPSSCLAFEDGINGLLSARAAGLKTVFVRDLRFQVQPPFEPELTVSCFDDLLF